jgi:uncharacterized membrane protein YfcA
MNPLTFRNSIIICIYSFLFILYMLVFYDDMLSVLNYPDALIIPIMSLGSFVAGSTFLGGGVVAFPALTKMLGFDPASAKIFSLAIQSVGMTSASIYVIAKTPAIPYKFIFISIIAGGLGVAISLFYFQSLFASTDIRLSFTLFVLCSLVIYLWLFKHNSIFSKYPDLSDSRSQLSCCDFNSVAIIFISGFLGGVISGFIGSGADLMVFCLLSLYFHIDLKNATKISIIIMAAVSIIGIIFQIVAVGNLPPEIMNLWVLAAPVVLLGAPIGAIFLKKVKPTTLLIFIAVIVMVEIITTILLVNVETWKFIVHFIFATILIMLLYQLHLNSPYKPSIPN